MMPYMKQKKWEEIGFVLNNKIRCQTKWKIEIEVWSMPIILENL